MKLSTQGRVYIAVGYTDMRKSINGLCQLVDDNSDTDIFADHLFAFRNRRRDIIKILFWDNNGFCLWHKRLEHDRIHWPKLELEIINIDSMHM